MEGGAAASAFLPPPRRQIALSVAWRRPWCPGDEQEGLLQTRAEDAIAAREEEEEEESGCAGGGGRRGGGANELRRGVPLSDCVLERDLDEQHGVVLGGRRAGCFGSVGAAAHVQEELRT